MRCLLAGEECEIFTVRTCLRKRFACWPSGVLSRARYLLEARANNVQIYVLAVSCVKGPKKLIVLFKFHRKS